MKENSETILMGDLNFDARAIKKIKMKKLHMKKLLTKCTKL